MSDIVDTAFGELVARGDVAPWLVESRIGRLPGVQNENTDTLPDSSQDWPRLEGRRTPGLVDRRPFRGGWYLPTYLLDTDATIHGDGGDTAFEFSVVQSGDVAEDGAPFSTATLTLRFRKLIPTDLVDDPMLEEVPDLRIDVTLFVPVTGHDGVRKPLPIDAEITDTDDETTTVTVTLVGDQVRAVYAHLTRRGEAELHIACRYSAYQKVFVSERQDAPAAVGPEFRGHLQFALVGDGTHDSSGDDMPTFGVCEYFPVTARAVRTVPIGLLFHTDAYRTRFTISAGGSTRPIIDERDVSEIAGPRSEYRELTAPAGFRDRYPSLRTAYFGQVTGTVIAVPALYGILVDATGLAARCDSIIDTTHADGTGARFHFTFTLAALADPVDMARLAADLPDLPEARGRTVHLALPVGLDRRDTPALDGFPTATATFANGEEPGTIQLAVDIADDPSTPATALANAFLGQLSVKGTAPLFADIAVAVDGLLPQPVRTQAVLNVRRTAGIGDLIAAVSDGRATAANRCPHDLTLHAVALTGDGGVTLTPLNDVTLAAGQTMTIAEHAADAVTAAVSHGLAVADTVTPQQMRAFIRFHTDVIQQVQHPLTVNAVGLFGPAGVTGLRLQFAVDDHPDIPVPPMSLSAAAPIGVVHVAVPLDVAITGLDCTVAITVVEASGTRAVSLVHDFAHEPILVVTADTIQ